MRIPFLRRKEPESLQSVVSRATYVVPSLMPWPRLGPPRTLEENRAAAKRIRRVRNAAANGDLPT